MALDLQTVIKWRDDLVQARLSGIREVQDQNGERIAYRSDSEMARAIEAAERTIASLKGDRQPRTVIFKTSKGT